MTADYRSNPAVEFHSHQAERFENYYNKLNDKPFSASFIYTRRRLDDTLFRLIPERGDGLRLLDLGCGTGHYMTMLAQRGFEVVGVDGADEMLAKARANNPEAEVLQGDVENIPLPDASFDYVICIEVLRYLHNWPKCVQEMGRILKPGGVCLATAMPLLNSNGYWFVNRLSKLIPLGNLSRIQQEFVTGPGLRRQFRDAGFDKTDVHGVYTGPINWVERLTPWFFPTALKVWEPFDKALADLPLLRELSDMFLMHAVRGDRRG